METLLEKETFASAEVNHGLTPERKIDFLRQMLRIRRFEQAALKQYQTSGQIGGFLHLYSGQEAVAIGTLSLRSEDDQVIAGYRTHGQALAMGMTMNECMAELFGKATGCSKGKGGSMHLFAPDKNYWGGHGVVAGHTPLGLGLAFALKYKGIKGCCLCYLGDGAVNQGVYQATLNLASLWSLPVIYIIENNQYSMGTSQERSSAYRDCLAARAEGYNIEWDRFNGEDIYEVRAKTWPAIQRAREESRPTVLEVATYRYYGHSVSDANAKKYRSPEEIDNYRKLHDPIQLWQKRLLDEGVMTEEQAAELDAAAAAEAAESVRFAGESPLPDKTDIFSDVYSEVDRQTPAGQTGKFFFND
ncbi:MAG: pyruvate dehydrogenase (acetyl-transferring) E1 component subunit alpha [Verrucomicrobia bacterium]|nr:pyruvate dehydrogenase (acetyl-transferring) E1 component subunit alpha [Verrucomicrobiota bacterium]MDE3100262.1 pyruvate dehydrogenase (acetyl-transferring) E1 component subunit alpha [Verrucomicrobiota bacterium]